MKIKVTASRRDDILRRKAEYEEQYNAQKAKHDEQYGQYQDALYSVFDQVEAAVREKLGDDIGELEIHVDTRNGKGLYVRIGNSKGSPRREAHAALTWEWTATLKKDGSVSKESSSWSGLEAVTPEQIEDLKQTVRQLEIINSLDWAALLNRALPNWEDYITVHEPSLRDKPDFEFELLQADLEESIGANVLIKAHEGRNYRGDVYFQILRDSGSQYAVKELPAYYVDQILQGKEIPYRDRTITTLAELADEFGSAIRIRKANFMSMIYKPLQTQAF